MVQRSLRAACLSYAAVLELGSGGPSSRSHGVVLRLRPPAIRGSGTGGHAHETCALGGRCASTTWTGGLILARAPGSGRGSVNCACVYCVYMFGPGAAARAGNTEIPLVITSVFSLHAARTDEFIDRSSALISALISPREAPLTLTRPLVFAPHAVTALTPRLILDSSPPPTHDLKGITTSRHVCAQCPPRVPRSSAPRPAPRPRTRCGWRARSSPASAAGPRR